MSTMTETETERDEQIRFDTDTPESAFEAAFAELDLLCREYQGQRRQLYDAVHKDGPDSVAAQRLRGAIVMAGREIRTKQEDYYLRGVSVWVSYDSNGQPIRASRTRHFEIN